MKRRKGSRAEILRLQWELKENWRSVQLALEQIRDGQERLNEARQMCALIQRWIEEEGS